MDYAVTACWVSALAYGDVGIYGVLEPPSTPYSSVAA